MTKCKCLKVVLTNCINYDNKSAINIIKDIESTTLQAMNYAMREYYLWEIEKKQIKNDTGNFPNEKEMYGKTYRNVIETTMKSIMNICNTSNVSQTNNFVYKKWNNIKRDVLNNKINIVNYKSNNPIYIKSNNFNIESTNQGFNIHLRLFGREFQKQNKLNELIFKVDKIDTSKKSILINLISKTYKQGMGQLKFSKKNKLEFLISYEPPIKQNEFIEGRVLGVDLGMAVPVYMSLNNNPDIKMSLGNYDDFTKKKIQFQNRKQKLQHALALNTGGKGRNRKLKALNKFRNYESNFAKTYNHNLSNAIIKFAKDNKCEFINLEKIDRKGLDDRVLRNWTYYQLQELINYKAQFENIKVRKVSSHYTSQMCSKCGYIDENNRKTQDKFVCLKCGYKANADYNASQNIANSTEFIK